MLKKNYYISLMEYLPKKHSTQWIKIYIVTTILYYAVISIISFIIPGGLQNIIYYFVTTVVLIFANLIACLFGFFNLKHIYILSSLGILVGTIIMTLMLSEDYNGWELLAGAMLFIIISLIALIIGVIIQVIIYIINKHRTKKEDNIV